MENLIGTVKEINDKKGFITILTENNISIIVEVLESTNLPNIGDEFTGNLKTLGEQTLYNETSKEKIRVFIQDLK